MDPADTKAPPVASFSINRFGARVILKSFPLYYILTPIFELNAIWKMPRNSARNPHTFKSDASPDR